MWIVGIVIYVVIGFFVGMSSFSRLSVEQSSLQLEHPVLFVLLTAILWPVLLLARGGRP